MKKYQMIEMVIVLLAVFTAASCDVNQAYETKEKPTPSEPDSTDIRIEVLDHDTDERIQSAEILLDSTVVASDGLFTETREEEDVDINVLARADDYQKMSEPRVINTSTDVSITIRLSKIKDHEPKPPVARFSFSTNESLTASFDGSESSDPDGDEDDLIYEWEFGDGETGSGMTTDHTYEESGNYDVTLTVTDPGDLSSKETHTVSVGTDNQPPKVKFTVESKDELTVHFENQSSDPDGDELSYDWNFGDGESSNTEHPSHTYADPGDYEVTLTGTDPHGADDTYQKTVTVERKKSEQYEHEITIDASDKIWVSNYQNRPQDQLLHFGEVRPIMTNEDPIGTVDMTIRMKLDDDQPEHIFAEIIFDDGSKIETPIFPDQSGIDGWTNVTVEIPAEEFAGQAKELAEVRVIHGDEKDSSKPDGEDDVIFATTNDNGKVWFKWRIPADSRSKIAGSNKFNSTAKVN